jgi:tetratricopeptide (TPR) repeat protein
MEELIQKGDEFDLKFKPVEALQCYLPAEKMQPENVEILLRIARQYRHQMADTAAIKEKIRLSDSALIYAKRALSLSPRNSEANLSVAICYGKALEIYSNKEKMAALCCIKSFADQAVALNAKNDLAWYVLGRWNQRVADMGGVKRKVAEMAFGALPKASNDEAVKCYEKAIRLNPYRSVYYVEMGIACAAMSNVKDAKTYISKGLILPNTGKDDIEIKKRGRETLASLM